MAASTKPARGAFAIGSSHRQEGETWINRAEKSSSRARGQRQRTLQSSKHPAFPVTPTEIAAACIEAAKAGAAGVRLHVHVRDLKTGEGSRDPNLFKETVDRVRDSGVDVLINLTAGLGAFFLPDPVDESRGLPESDVIGVEERLLHLELCRPDIASLDITTGNQVEGPMEFVYLNTTRTLRGMAKGFQRLK